MGCCWCAQCAGKDGVVGYNARINRKTADYIKQKWPDKIVYVITFVISLELIRNGVTTILHS